MSTYLARNSLFVGNLTWTYVFIISSYHVVHPCSLATCIGFSRTLYIDAILEVSLKVIDGVYIVLLSDVSFFPFVYILGSCINPLIAYSCDYVYVMCPIFCTSMSLSNMYRISSHLVYRCYARTQTSHTFLHAHTLTSLYVYMLELGISCLLIVLISEFVRQCHE